MKYDLLIIGGGPAGLTSGLYAARAGLKTLLLEKAAPGGQAAVTDMIDNYPGFPEGISGPELMMKFMAQAERFGLESRFEGVLEVSLSPGEKRVKTDGGEYSAQGVIIASGASPRELGVPGEKEFRGRGVSYCATCDGAFFRNKRVLVAGGGDAAVEEGIFLTKFASQVILVHRRDALRAARVLQDRAQVNEKMEIRYHTVVEEIRGGRLVEKVKLKDTKTGAVMEEPVSGVFVFVGTEPNTGFLGQTVTLNESGYILTNETLGTSVPGVFAAGDVRAKFLRQVSTAVGDGAVAAMAAERWLAEQAK
ncbi:MAG: thioredoxin-disulfide reductase [Syntrophomonadaceae bacterium]|nr:thioredoxin-disulfide reductase [Syntrophomonadaceae bacterium]